MKPNSSSHATLVDYHSQAIYLIGGLIESPVQPTEDPDGIEFNKQYPGKVLNKIHALKRNGDAWEEFCTLKQPRCDLEALLVGGKLFIFGGYCGIKGGKPLCTTEIEIVDLHTRETSSAQFRLPMGVCGTSVAWHGSYLLMIGGKRSGNKTTSVMKVDFNDKTIISLRNLQQERSNSITIPVRHDEVIVFGGAGKSENGAIRTGEIRYWNEHLQDYTWKNIGEIRGSNHIENPDEYDTVTTTFSVNAGDDDNFPNFSIESNFLFGNEEAPFLMEITGSIDIKFYPAPLKLQQKTGQLAYRKDPATIYFFAGTDSAHKLFSKKTFKLDIPTKEVTEVGKMNISRYNLATERYKVDINIIDRTTSTFQEELLRATNISTQSRSSTSPPKNGSLAPICSHPEVVI